MKEHERFVKKILERLEKIDPEYIELFLTRLTRERNFLNDLVNLLDEGILVLNSNKEIILINTAAVKILNIPDEDPSGKNIMRCLIDDQIKIFFDRIWELPDKSINTEIHLESPRKMYLGVIIINYLLEDDENLFDKIFIFSDITNRLMQMEELLKNEKLQTYSLLSAGVAHEIGNPLNSLDIHTQLLEKLLSEIDFERKSEIMELVQISKEEITRMDEIIKRFLKTIRPFQLRLQEENMADTIQNTLDAMSSEFKIFNIEIKTSFPENPVFFLYDAGLMQQALINLLKNAVQAMPDGGMITIQLSLNKDICKIMITDTGKGIPQRQLKFIFDPYFTTRPEGTGLGLMIVNRIILAHNGEISVISEENIGTTFIITLPVKRRGEKYLPESKKEDAE